MNEFQRALAEGRKPEFKTGRRAKTDVVMETTVRCTICMKKFGQRNKIKKHGKWYHEECFEDVHKKAKAYGGVKQKDKRPAMRQV